MQTVEQCVETCRAALEHARVHFGHGTDNATDEAAWLVLHVLGEPLDGSFGNWQRPVGQDEHARIRHLLERRVRERVPLAYLLGEAWFCGMRFEVNPDVLVPRSPLAELIRRRFRPWIDPHRVRVALDLCTGSGCIAIAVAKYLPEVRVDACDIDPAALEVARRNIALHGVGKRVRLARSDLYDALGGRRYDLIVSNPPYVPEGQGDTLPPEYRAEPARGLYAGEDGLEAALRILRDAPDHLRAGGILVCEVGESAGRLEALLPEVPFVWLEFEQGGEGAFTMDLDALVAAQGMVQRVMEQRSNVV